MNDDRDLKALYVPPPVSDAERELRDWLKKCKEILKGREPVEVAHLAILSGFERSLVYSVLSYFEDAMRGTHVENRAAWHLWHIDQSFKQFQRLRREKESVKELDLRPLWEDLMLYQTGQAITLQRGAQHDGKRSHAR